MHALRYRFCDFDTSRPLVILACKEPDCTSLCWYYRHHATYTPHYYAAYAALPKRTVNTK